MMNNLSAKAKLYMTGLAALLYAAIAPVKADGITFSEYINGCKTAEAETRPFLADAFEGIGSAVLNHENGHLREIGYDGKLSFDDGGGIFHISTKSYDVIKSKEKYNEFVFGGIGASKEAYELARNEMMGRRKATRSEAIAYLYAAADNVAYGAESAALNGYGDVGYIASSTNADWAYGTRALDAVFLLADPYFRYLIGAALGKEPELPKRKDFEIRPYVFAGPNTGDAVGVKGKIVW